jgi:phospholipid-transporting ATPase
MKEMPNNTVVTAKFNIFNFIPLNIYNQLSKAQNLYFIMISYMQTLTSITISAGKPVQAAPLIGVMIASILKDLYEDLKRHRQDAEENNQSATMWNEKN